MDHADCHICLRKTRPRGNAVYFALIAGLTVGYGDITL